MARFFIKNCQMKGSIAEIEGPDVHHILKVLRMRPGQELFLVDEAGLEHRAIIEMLDPQRVECTLVGMQEVHREPPVEVVLCQGLPKGDKLELIIQKSVELGVNRIIPMRCERSVVQLTGDKASKRLERWQRVAVEAAKQSRRNKIPEVTALADFAKTIEMIPEQSLAVMPWEEEQGLGLKKVLTSYNNNSQIWLFIGPEGGLTQAEAQRARSAGVTPVTLGPRILRTETAGIASLAMVLYQLGDLGGSVD